MKSFFTSAIAVTLFVLCLVEKESKERDLKAQRTKTYLADSLNSDDMILSEPAYADLDNGQLNISPEQRQFSELALSDSTAKMLEPTPFLGKLPLLNRLISSNNLN
ncbi:hypothetical protein SAMN04487995_5798 [Dyadobacter koreensis]|uniref:Uncharacterized protein n=1 Tax=Dyadobacter koreensis TaxID=408657 RepID=A0A1H7APD3_9BACT|nr:hypothetical protein [Dyadobacter koreensis]SEJ67198.1 hypothetical protein SAMN04487995_5798 [Dyadobacter koreensis]